MTIRRSLFSVSPPTVAVEITQHRVSAASIVPRAGGLAVAAHAREDLPDGAVSPGLNGPNIGAPAAVVDALRRVFDRIGARPKRVALAIPDSAAKVSVLRFEKIPDRAHDLDELIRWQVRKAAPFPLEQAQLTYSQGVAVAGGGKELVVVLARRDIIQEYEGVCAAAGAHAGVVDLSTFNVINAVLAGPARPVEDWLLVHVTPQDATMAILRGPHLVFFRNGVADGEGGLADLIHRTAMYYEDRLNGTGFGRVLLTGIGAASAEQGPESDDLRKTLEQRLGTRVDSVDTRDAAALPDKIAPGPELLGTLAPLVGLIVRERAA